MKIPLIDSTLFLAVKCFHRLGKIQTVQKLSDVNLDRVRSILIAVTTALGDSITFTPALTALRDRFPHARIVCLYHHAFSSLYETDPRMDRIIPYYGKYKRLGATLKALREESCELALLPYMNDPDIIPLVLAGGSRILYRMPGRNTIYSCLVADADLLSSTPPGDHANVRAANMVRRLGCEIGDINTSLHLHPDSAGKIDHILNPLQSTAPTFYIGFHPGASIPEKRWPRSSFEELGKQLLETFKDARILVTGSSAERNLCEDICKNDRTGRMTNLAGVITIRDMPELLRRLSIFISGDTGVAVMAYAVHCRTITLFWKTNPALSGPLNSGARHRIIQRETADAVLPELVYSQALEQIRC